MHPTLSSLRKLTTGALILLVAACSSDAPTAVAPNARLIAPPAPGSVTPNEPSRVLQYLDTVKVTFTVTPTVGGAARIGNHMVSFPKNTICDMSVTAYGPSEWQKPCTVTSTPVTITAVSRVDKNGRPQVDFSPALRFRVNNNGELPTLYLRDADASVRSWSSINYCVGPTTRCVNEALTDPALATQRDPATGFLYRFIRHFSGYNVWA